MAKRKKAKANRPITEASRLLSRNPPRNGTARRRGHFRRFERSGTYSGHSHFGRNLQKVVVLPTAFGKNYHKDLEELEAQQRKEGKPLTRNEAQKWVSGRWKTAIGHHENKADAYDLIMKRAKPYLTHSEKSKGVGIKGARILPATFAKRFTIKNGKKFAYDDRRPLTIHKDRPLYSHKREYMSDTISLNDLLNGRTPENMFANEPDNKRVSKQEQERARKDLAKSIFGDLELRKGLTPEVADNMLSDLYGSFRWLHNKYRIAHNDAHGRNIRIYRGKPHLEDFGQYVDLKSTDAREAGVAIGHDLALLSRNFTGVLDRRKLANRINSHISNLDYGLDVKVTAKNAVKAYSEKEGYEELKPVADLL